MFVQKEVGKLRLCIDYWALYEITRKVPHPLPLISKVLDQLAAAKYFTNLDIKDDYDNTTSEEGNR